MPNYTTNLNLVKPLQTDNYNIDDANGNMDIIDTEIKKINDEVTSQKADMTTEKINVITSNTKLPTDLPATFPLGISTTYSSSANWATSLGVNNSNKRYQIDTFKGDRYLSTVQRVTIINVTTGAIGETIAIFQRSAHGSAWGSWEKVILEKDMTVELDKKAPINSPTFTGTANVTANTNYTTSQLRNAKFQTTIPSTLANGEICFVYE